MSIYIHLARIIGLLCGFLGRLLRVDLIKWVSYVRPYVRPSTKSFFDFTEIWYVGRGRWEMHDGMQYDPIQGQGKVTSPWKSEILPFSEAIFSSIYNRGWQMTTES